MQGILAVLVVLMITFTLLLDTSIAAEKSKVKKEKTKTSQQKQTQMKKKSSEIYDLNPIDLSRTTLSQNYIGHDLKGIYEALKKREKAAMKDEYETTEQYKQRIQNEEHKPLIGTLTVNDLFSFVVNPGTTEIILGVNRGYRSILVSNKYDIDSQTLTLMLRTTGLAFSDYVDFDIDSKIIKVDEVRIRGPELYYNESIYIGSNAYGVVTEVRRILWKIIDLTLSNTSSLPLTYEDDGYSNYVPWIKIDLRNITPETAKTIRRNLCITILYKLKEPYISSEETGRTEPTRDYPIDMSYIIPHVNAIAKEIWVFNRTDGEILLKVKTD